MKFRELLYEIYKVDWKRSHIIFPQREIDVIVDFYEAKNEGDIDENMTIAEYIEDVGYSGELYVSFNEFLENEYTDGQYMNFLIEGYIAAHKQEDFKNAYNEEINALGEELEV